jgi:peptidoglycan hydrolase-like protein with peptidoglycan-binding domain
MASAFDNLAPRVMADLIHDFDLTPEQAAGIVGNLGAESGLRAINEVRPLVSGSRGGFGWAQWTGTRRRQFESWVAGHRLDPTSYEANYGFLKAELSGSVPNGDAGARQAIAHVKRTTTVEAAAQTFEAKFERAGKPNMAGRVRLGHRALDLWHRSPVIHRGSHQMPSSKVVLRPGERGPDVEALQRALTERKYNVGKIDGIYGPLTVQAVLAFQYHNGLVPDGNVDADTWAALRGAPVRPLSPERERAIADDLRRGGSDTVWYGDRTRYLGWLSSMFGGLGLLNSGYNNYGGKTGGTAGLSPEVIARAFVENKDSITRIWGDTEQVRTAIQKAEQFLGGARGSGQTLSDMLVTVVNSVLPGFGGSLGMLGIGLLTTLMGQRVIQRRVQNQRDAINLSPLRLF